MFGRWQHGDVLDTFVVGLAGFLDAAVPGIAGRGGWAVMVASSWIEMGEGLKNKKPPGFAASAVGMGRFQWACALPLIRRGPRSKTKNKTRCELAWNQCSTVFVAAQQARGIVARRQLCAWTAKTGDSQLSPQAPKPGPHALPARQPLWQCIGQIALRTLSCSYMSMSSNAFAQRAPGQQLKLVESRRSRARCARSRPAARRRRRGAAPAAPAGRRQTRTTHAKQSPAPCQKKLVLACALGQATTRRVMVGCRCWCGAGASPLQCASTAPPGCRATGANPRPPRLHAEKRLMSPNDWSVCCKLESDAGMV
jgi:hypothetical protein